MITTLNLFLIVYLVCFGLFLALFMSGKDKAKIGLNKEFFSIIGLSLAIAIVPALILNWPLRDLSTEVYVITPEKDGEGYKTEEYHLIFPTKGIPYSVCKKCHL